MRMRLVGDADAEAAEALALALDLDDFDPADRPGGGDVGAAIRLLVQAHDVDDPDLLDLRRDQVGGGADDVGQRERLDRKSTRLNSSHALTSRMPSSA